MGHVEYNCEKIIEKSIKIMKERLSKRGICLSAYAEIGLRSLNQALLDCLGGEEVAPYTLASFDPGVGKTEGVCCFLKAWSEASFTPKGSVLIAVHTKEQIESLVKKLGLNEADYACFTSDADINALGRGVKDRYGARVLITTQQMLQSRLGDCLVYDKATGVVARKSVAFASATDFFYDGTRRNVVIWDESFILAEHLTIPVVPLLSLAGKVERLHKGLAAVMFDFASKVMSAEAGQQFAIPVQFGDALAVAHSKGSLMAACINVDERELLEVLAKAAGRNFILRNDGGVAGLTLAGASAPLPPDFSPVVVLDASGRVRGTYDLMERKVDLKRLPVVKNDYRNVKVHVWEKACGKHALQNIFLRSAIVDEVAKVIASKPSEEWLVIGAKAEGHSGGVDLFDEIKKQSAGLGAISVSYLNFGRHTATNEYAHIKNIIVVGSNLYRHSSYEALAAAANGGDLAFLGDDHRSLFYQAEYMHHILQAGLRGNGRNAVGGVAGQCDIYIVTSPNICFSSFNKAFPGSSVSVWKPSCKLSDKAISLFEAIRDFFAGTEEKVMSKGKDRRMSGLHKNSMARVLDSEHFKHLMASIGVIDRHRHFELTS